jgi:hypothetical protein
MKIVYVVRDYDDYFVLKRDYTETVGFSSTIVWMLAYETPRDAKDEYLRIGESTIIESM